MQFFFSPSAAGFFSPDFHTSIPEDAIEISADEHAALLAGQSQGKCIVADGGGRPTLVDPPPPTDDQLAAAARAQRDETLAGTDWLVARHRDEVDAGGKTTLTADQFKALLAYRQALRDLPDQKGFPAVAMPESPDFL